MSRRIEGMDMKAFVGKELDSRQFPPSINFQASPKILMKHQGF